MNKQDKSLQEIRNFGGKKMNANDGKSGREMEQIQKTGKMISDMILGFQTTQLLYTATSLGIFEQLAASSVPLTALTISNKIGTNAQATERLMNACCGLRLLEKETNEQGQFLYKNSMSANLFLVKSSPMSFKPLISSVGDLYTLWGKLPEGVKEGKPQISKAMGSGEDYFDAWSSDTKRLEFLQAMHMFCKMDAPFVVNAFDLSEFQTICDLGGGTGAISAALTKTYPGSQATIFELPKVVNCAQHFVSEEDSKNVQFQAGDFCKDDLPSADLYVLSHVIHDWQEEKVDQILTKIYDSLQPGGALLILEKILTENKDGPVETLMFDIGMLVGAQGKERSASEYTKLLQNNGFSDIEVKLLPKAKWRDAILARKM